MARRRGRSGLAGAGLLFVSCVLSGRPASARPFAASVDQRSLVQLDLSSEFAAVRAPFFTENFPVLQAHGCLFSLAGSTAISPEWSLGARVPLLLMSVRQPAGSYVDRATWGNPTLFIARVLRPTSPRLDWLMGWGEVELGLPLAQPGSAPSLLNSRALEAANAAESYLAPESFTPGALSVVLRAGLAVERGVWGARAEVALPVLLRVRDAQLPAAATAHRWGLLPNAELVGWARLFGPLRFSCAVQAAFALARLFEPWRQTAGVQPSVRPSLSVLLSPHFDLNAFFLAPIGGPLGSAVRTGGLGIEVR